MIRGLTGSCHDAWRHVTANRRDYVRVSAIPAGLMVVFILAYIIPFGGFMAHVFEAASAGRDIEDGLVARIIAVQAIAMVASLAAMAVSNWWCVRLVRLVMLDDRRWFALDGGIAMSTLMWLLYLMGIGAVAMLAAMAVVLPVMLVAGLSAPFMIGNEPGLGLAVAAGLGGVIVLGAWITLITFVWLRLASGIVPVALGHTPDFYRDLWQRSAGFGWALSWRAVLVFLGVFLVAAVLTGTAVAGSVIDLVRASSAGAEPDLSLITPIIWRAMAVQMPVLIAAVPLVWWLMTWLCAVYRRIGEANGHDVIDTLAG